YQIDPAPYQAAYDSAQADLSKREANLNLVQVKKKRIQQLFEKKVASTQDLDEILAQVLQAKADIEIAKAAILKAKINLDYTKVYAPITGRIGKSTVTKGALVTANQTDLMTTITRLDPIFVDLTQPSSEHMKLRRMLQVKNSLPVMLYIEDTEEEYRYEGKLEFSDVAIDESTGSVTLRALFPNPEGVLLPGLFVRAKIQLERFNAILIPQRAVIRGSDGKARVWILGAQNEVTLKEISLGRALEDKWLVEKGLQVGDLLLLNGFQKIAPGTIVKPIYLDSEQPMQPPSALKPGEG
ncbi:MAG TPA: efflux RND transporter periplasmic adaptor subunit, partial [Gammaproteobacteria bacterium]|nr:efflux RND transporter periplasmic adaptor subunit [Gammaproteobacteria bacterium]